MLSSQFAFVVCLVGSSLAIPLVEKEFFWYPTDKGTIVPAFLKGLPSNPKVTAIEDDVVFYHYLTGESGDGRVVTPDCDQCLTDFVQGVPTVFLAHGFGSDHVGGFGTRHRTGFGNRNEPINLVFVNWSKLAAAPWYEFAANNVKPVGEYVAKMMNFLIQQNVTTRNDLIFIGHSLGAHVANHVSANLQGGILHHVFALDPALPLFGVKEDDERIDPADGDFVNVIHASMGTLLDGGLAFTEPRGHVDFYVGPNSGKHQPGCPSFDFGACSHSRAYHYLTESIYRPSAFPSCKCENWEEYDSGACACDDQVAFGWETPSTTRGVYYLSTNSEEPYGQGEQ